MAVTKSAKKKLRQDLKKAAINRRWKRKLKEALKLVQKKPTADYIKKAQSLIDKVAKKKIIHQNKASRLKKKIYKLLPKKALPAKKRPTKAKRTIKTRRS